MSRGGIRLVSGAGVAFSLEKATPLFCALEEGSSLLGTGEAGEQRGCSWTGAVKTAGGAGVGTRSGGELEKGKRESGAAAGGKDAARCRQSVISMSRWAGKGKEKKNVGTPKHFCFLSIICWKVGK